MKIFDQSRNRPGPHWARLAAAGLLAAAALVGCGGGSDGAPGATGAAGAAGATGATGAPGKDATAVTKLANMTPDQWVNMNWSATISSAAIGTDGKPVVKFKVLDDKGNPISGLAYPSLNTINSTATIPAYAHFGFTVAKLVPGTNGSPNRWVSYIVTSTPTFKSATDHSTAVSYTHLTLPTKRIV